MKSGCYCSNACNSISFIKTIDKVKHMLHDQKFSSSLVSFNKLESLVNNVIYFDDYAIFLSNKVITKRIGISRCVKGIQYIFGVGCSMYLQGYAPLDKRDDKKLLHKKWGQPISRFKG